MLCVTSFSSPITRFIFLCTFRKTHEDKNKYFFFAILPRGHAPLPVVHFQTGLRHSWPITPSRLISQTIKYLRQPPTKEYPRTIVMRACSSHVPKNTKRISEMGRFTLEDNFQRVFTCKLRPFLINVWIFLSKHSSGLLTHGNQKCMRFTLSRLASKCIHTTMIYSAMNALIPQYYSVKNCLHLTHFFPRQHTAYNKHPHWNELSLSVSEYPWNHGWGKRLFQMSLSSPALLGKTETGRSYFLPNCIRLFSHSTDNMRNMQIQWGLREQFHSTVGSRVHN
jgi:hypothetical protein